MWHEQSDLFDGAENAFDEWKMNAIHLNTISIIQVQPIMRFFLSYFAEPS